MTINEMVKQRKSAMREAKRLLHAADSTLEEAERLIERVNSRKNKIPDIQDLDKITSFVKMTSENLTVLMTFIANLATLFGL